MLAIKVLVFTATLLKCTFGFDYVKTVEQVTGVSYGNLRYSHQNVTVFYDDLGHSIYLVRWDYIVHERQVWDSFVILRHFYSKTTRAEYDVELAYSRNFDPNLAKNYQTFRLQDMKEFPTGEVVVENCQKLYSENCQQSETRGEILNFFIYYTENSKPIDVILVSIDCLGDSFSSFSCLGDALHGKIVKSWDNVGNGWIGGNMKGGPIIYNSKAIQNEVMANKDLTDCRLETKDGKVMVFDGQSIGVVGFSQNSIQTKFDIRKYKDIKSLSFNCHKGPQGDNFEKSGSYGASLDAFDSAVKTRKLLMDANSYAYGLNPGIWQTAQGSAPLKLVVNTPGLNGQAIRSMKGDDSDTIFFGGKSTNSNNNYPLSSCLDAVAHEIGHGIAFHSAHLIGSGESGCLHEAIGDILGTLVEHREMGSTDWMFAANCSDWLSSERNQLIIPIAN